MKRFFKMFSRKYREQKNEEMQELLDECARRRANGWDVREINTVMRTSLRLYCES